MSRIILLDVRPANTPSVGQGVAERVRPRVLANVHDEGCAKDVAFLIAHPAIDRKSTRLNSSHIQKSRMPSSA